MTADLMLARRTAVVVLDGTPHRVRRGRTTAHADAPVVRARPDLWRPIVVDYPATGPATHITINVSEVPDEKALVEAVRAAITNHPGGTVVALGGNDSRASTLAPAGGAAAKPAPKAIRAWARERGIEVPARGTLPDDVVAAYQAAQEQ